MGQWGFGGCEPSKRKVIVPDVLVTESPYPTPHATDIVQCVGVFFSDRKTEDRGGLRETGFLLLVRTHTTDHTSYPGDPTVVSVTVVSTPVSGSDLRHLNMNPVRVQ